MRNQISPAYIRVFIEKKTWYKTQKTTHEIQLNPYAPNYGGRKLEKGNTRICVLRD